MIDEHLTEKQQAFLCDVIFQKLARINILTGSVRSGKTYVSLIAWAVMVAEYPESQAYIMVGKTITSLKRNCLIPLTQFLDEGDYSLNISRKELILFGRKVYLEGVNDSRSEAKIRGLTLQAAYIDELTLCSYEFFGMLLSRLSLPNAKLLATTNPDAPQHWVKKDFIDRAVDLSLRTWQFLLDDNTTLESEYKDNLKKEYTGVYYDRFVLGKWVAAEGIIYRDFADNPERYFYSGRPMDKLSMINIGVDYGASRSKTTFVAVGIGSGFREIWILAEKALTGVFSPEKIYDEFEAFVKEVERAYGKVYHAFCDYGALGQVITAGLKNRIWKNGLAIKVCDCSKGRINDRIQLTCKLFAQNRLHINNKCEGIKKAFSSAIWDSKTDKDVRLDDGTVEIDYLDAFEYAIQVFYTQIIRTFT